MPIRRLYTPRKFFTLRKLAPFAAAALCLVVSPLSFSKDSKQATPDAAQALGYGVMLYEYFQHNHFNALTEFAIAEQRNDLDGHGTHPKLMEGGINLAFGMDQRAEQTFNTLLDGRNDAVVESQAWFYLGKIAYQRSDYHRSRKVLTQVGPQLPEELRDEYQSLSGLLLIRDQKLEGAEQALTKIKADSPFSAYLNFNLGAAYQNRYLKASDKSAAAKDWQQASLKLDTAAKQAQRLPKSRLHAQQQDEFRSLADRALLASGYALLAGGEQQEAVDRFKRVRLAGPYTSQAMLGYGWAEVEQQRFSEALTPWQHLIGQPLIDMAVQEAYTGVPYVYEKLGAKRKALEGFQDAENQYRAELQRIETASIRLKDSDIRSLFLVEQTDGFVDWVAIHDNLTINPQSPYLAELLAGHEFQSVLNDLRDLYALKANLEGWQRKLASFEFALESRYGARDKLRNQGRQQLLKSIAELESKRSQLYQQLSLAENQADAVAMLPRKQHRSVQRTQKVVEQAEQLLQRGHDAENQLKRARFLRGLAHWQAAESQAENNWNIRKNLQIIDDTLELAMDRKMSIDGLFADEVDLKVFDQRIKTAGVSLSSATVSNQAAITRAQKQLAAMAIAKLEQLHHGIKTHLAQTQLSIARLYDQASETDIRKLAHESAD